MIYSYLFMSLLKFWSIQTHYVKKKKKLRKNVSKDYPIDTCAFLDRWRTFHALGERRNFHGRHSMVKVEQQIPAYEHCILSFIYIYLTLELKNMCLLRTASTCLKQCWPWNISISRELFTGRYFCNGMMIAFHLRDNLLGLTKIHRETWQLNGYCTGLNCLNFNLNPGWPWLLYCVLSPNVSPRRCLNGYLQVKCQG